MFKLLIVDDEEMIRMGILNAIPWQEFEIGEVKTAVDGAEGLELFKEFLPEILLTDIRMPVMSGLELLEQAVQIQTIVKVIILSGFEDFSYARSALKLGAFDYILKTADMGELTGVIRKAVAAVKRDQEKERQIDKSLPILRDSYLNHLLWEGPDQGEAYHELSLAGITLAASVIVAVAEIDGLGLSDEEFRVGQERFIQSQIIKIAGTTLGNSGICFESNSGELLVIYNCKEDLHETENQKNFRDICEAITGVSHSNLGIFVSIGISEVGTGDSRVNIGYNQAKQALEYKLFAGKGCLISVSEIPEPINADFQVAADEEHRLISALRVADKQVVIDTISNIFEQIRRCPGIKVSYFHQICSDLLGSAFRVLHEFNINPVDVFGKEFRSWEEIKKYQNFEEARQWMAGVFEKIVLFVLHNKILKNKRVIEQAKQYIAEHYHEDLTLNIIAETVFMSPNYFSNLFSMEVGESFLEYLTALRIEKAKQLLGEKDAKAFEVGEKVGYDNPQYFSKIFKRYTLMTPSEYKEYLQRRL